MSKTPYVAFYTGDFMGGTEQMTDAQVGKYIRLLIVQFQASDGRLKPGYFDEKVGDDADLRAKFTRDETGYYNERMEEERLKAIAYSESRRKNIAKRYEKQPHNPSEPSYSSSSESTHVEDVNTHKNLHSDSDSNKDTSIILDTNSQTKSNNPDTKDDNKQPEVINKQIEAIYKAYPKKKGKGAADRAIRSALKKLPFDNLLQAVRKFAEAEKGKDPKYIPYPATWFNQERWLDEDDKPASPSCSKFRERFGRQEITKEDIEHRLNMELPE